MKNTEDIKSKIYEIIKAVDETEEAHDNGTISKGTYIKRREVLDIAYETLMWAAGMSEKINLEY